MFATLTTTATRCRRIVDTLGRVMGYAAGWGFIVTSFFMTFDIIARRFFGFSSQATTEITSYALAFGIAWGLAHTLSLRAHVRIDVLVMRFPLRVRVWLHLASLAALSVFAAFIAKSAYDLVAESLLFGATDISVIRTPLAIPQGLWAFGLCVFFLLIVLMLVENVLLAIAGRYETVEANLTTRTFHEEAAEALEAVGDLDAAQGLKP